MRQLMALLSFWQNSSASDHFLGGKCGRESESSEQTCIAQAVRPTVSRGFVRSKSVLLNVFAKATGYYRRYGMWLLNHAEDVLHAPTYKRSNHYRPEVQYALFLVWHAANRICAKRLMPFLPTLIDALERHEHLHITEECRRQLLSMSAATADRLLSSERTLGQHGLSTTRAGTR
jgi:hypothetical protein